MEQRGGGEETFIQLHLFIHRRDIAEMSLTFLKRIFMLVFSVHWPFNLWDYCIVG